MENIGSEFGSEPNESTGFKGNMVFIADDDTGADDQLWSARPDGTVSRAATVDPGIYEPSMLTVFNGGLYFSAEQDNRVHSVSLGAELWKLDASEVSLLNGLLQLQLQP